VDDEDAVEREVEEEFADVAEDDDERVSLIILLEEEDEEEEEEEEGASVTLSSCIVSDLQTLKENPDSLFFWAA